MFARLLLILALSAGLVGCATTYNPEQLSKPVVNRSIILTDNITSVQHINLNRERIETIIHAGEYVPEYEDARGVFYRGPIDVFERYSKDERIGPVYTDGGIWAPKCLKEKDNKAPVFIYAYLHQPNRNRNLAANKLSGDGVNTETNVQAYELAAAFPAQNAPQAVGNAVGAAVAVGLIEALVEAEKGRLIVMNGLFSESSLAELNAVVRTQLSSCAK